MSNYKAGTYNKMLSTGLNMNNVPVSGNLGFFQNPDDSNDILMGRPDGSSFIQYPEFQGGGTIQDETAFDFDASIDDFNLMNSPRSLTDWSGADKDNMFYDPNAYNFPNQIVTGKDDAEYDTTGDVINNVSLGNNYSKVNLIDYAIKNLDFDVGPNKFDGIFGNKTTFSSIKTKKPNPISGKHDDESEDVDLTTTKKPGKFKSKWNKFKGKIKAKWGELSETEQALITKQFQNALGTLGTMGDGLLQGTSQGPGAFNTGAMYKGDYA